MKYHFYVTYVNTWLPNSCFYWMFYTVGIKREINICFTLGILLLVCLFKSFIQKLVIVNFGLYKICLSVGSDYVIVCTFSYARDIKISTTEK